MMEPGQEKKKGFLDRLPRMGRISQLILIVAVFAALFGALLFIRGQLTSSQSNLDKTLANLQKITGPQQTPQTKFETDLAQAKAEAEAARASFPDPQGVPEIMDVLKKLADDNDIYITGTKIATSSPAGGIGPIISINVTLKGQVPKFQNFLLGLDTNLPTSQIKIVSFTVAAEEGEYDTASMSIDVQSYGGSPQ
jgi:hypothetical protein